MSIFLTVWLNICSMFFVHPVYVSMTTIDIDTQNGNITLSIKMFNDELETVLHNKYNVHSIMGTPGEHGDSRRLLKEYVNERFSIKVNNGEKIALVTDSMTIIEDAMWFYMKNADKQAIKHVEIDNRLLTDFFSEQKNLVLIGITGKKDKGHILNRKNSTIILSL